MSHRPFLLALPLMLATAVATPVQAEGMTISPNGDRTSVAGPSDTFTGMVTVTPLFAVNEQSIATGSLVEFTPAAHSNWHTHPAGQTLIVTSGSGWFQEEGGEKIAIGPGDAVSTRSGVKHWHGASSDQSMSRIAVTPMRDGSAVTWLEPVTDAQYRGHCLPSRIGMPIMRLPTFLALSFVLAPLEAGAKGSTDAIRSVALALDHHQEVTFDRGL